MSVKVFDHWPFVMGKCRKRKPTANKKLITGSQKPITALFLSMLLWLNTQAQINDLDTKLNDTLRGGNKYYAVVAVLVTIFTVLFAYLVYQDVKLNNIRKDLNSKFPNTNEQDRDA